MLSSRVCLRKIFSTLYMCIDKNVYHIYFYILSFLHLYIFYVIFYPLTDLVGLSINEKKLKKRLVF